MSDAPPSPPPQPPPPPPPRPTSGLPPGNYDIFIIPPHASGAGFLYLPSLAPHRNSFLAGVACTLLALALYLTLVPALRQFALSLAGSGGGVVVLVAGVGVGGWACGRVRLDDGDTSGAGGGNGKSTHTGPGGTKGPAYTTSAPPPPPPPHDPSTSSAEWERRREETRRAEEARRGVAAAEKEAQDKMRATERAQREREMRDRMDALRREKETKDKADRGKAATAAAGASAARTAAGAGARQTYQHPTAHSYAGEEDSLGSSGSSCSWASSTSTARTSPPPSQCGGHGGTAGLAYATKDPDKIVVRGAWRFAETDKAASPVARVLAGRDGVSPGLVLRLTGEGLFVDDEGRERALREWDVKAWGLRCVGVSLACFCSALCTPILRDCSQHHDPLVSLRTRVFVCMCRYVQLTPVP